MTSDNNELMELGLSGRNMISLPGKEMEIAESAYVNPYALLIGEITLGKDVTVWPGAILRADETSITIGEGSVVLDRAFIEAPKKNPVTIGSEVMISHGAIIHGARIEDRALVGIGAIILNGAVVGKNSIIAAGSVVKPGTRIPEGTMAAGIPAVEKRRVRPEEMKKMPAQTKEVRKKAREYGAFYLLNKGL